jgi:acyl-CoA dehydrogenase
LADQQQPNTLEASIAKAYCPPAALEAVSACMDIVGDAAIRNDRLLEKLYRDVKALDIVEGTGQIQRRIIARKIAAYPYE